MLRFTLLLILISLITTSSCTISNSDSSKDKERTDINTLYIKRLPEIDYVEYSNFPSKEGWPEEGDVVTWRGYIKNWGNKDVKNISYKWLLDDKIESSGIINNISGLETTSITLELPWSFERSQLELIVEFDDLFPENNSLNVYTDALSMGIYVEKTFYDFFHENQNKLGIQSNSFEDWMQRNVNMLNEMFEDSKFESAPKGVLDRVRIDDIHIVEDGELPLIPITKERIFDPKQARPNIVDKSVDLQWGFPAEQIGVYRNYLTSPKDKFNQFYISGFVLHEILHGRYLSDLNSSDIYHNTRDSKIEIEFNNQNIIESGLMPYITDTFNGSENNYQVYKTQNNGLMTSITNFFFSEAEVLALNSISGNRAIAGNYNAPENLAAYLSFLPQKNYIRFIESGSNEIIESAKLYIYQSENIRPELVASEETYPYAKYFDNEYDSEHDLAENAYFYVGSNLFSKSDKLIYDGYFNFSDIFVNNVAIAKIETDTKVGYTVIDGLSFNVQYMQGNKLEAYYELEVQLFDKPNASR